MIDLLTNKIERRGMRVDVTPQARALVERERNRIIREKGLLRARREIVSEAIIKAYAQPAM